MGADVTARLSHGSHRQHTEPRLWDLEFDTKFHFGIAGISDITIRTNLD